MTNIPITSTLRKKSAEKLRFLPSESRSVFSSGIGINSLPEIPVRFLSYILPMISVVQSYEQSIGQIYAADGFALKMGISLDTVRDNVQTLNTLIEKFIQDFFPNIFPRMAFSPEKCADGEAVLEKRARLVSNMVEIILEDGDPSIIRFADNRKGEGSIRIPLEYMASHALYMRDPVTDDPRLFLVDNPPGFENETVTMIGGPAEEIFYKARTRILRAMNIPAEQQNIQLFTDIGRLPPYYRKLGEPVVGETIPRTRVEEFFKNIDLQLRFDYLMLVLSCSPIPNFDLLKKKMDDFTQTDWKMLEDGFERLTYFLNRC